MRETLINWMCVCTFACVVAPWSGCVAVYKRENVVVKVRDAATNQPVEGAMIEVTYRGYMMMNTPDPDHAHTGADGEASMRLATWDPGFHWTVRASGHPIEFGDGGLPDPPRQEYLERMGEKYLLVAPNQVMTVDLRRPSVRLILWEGYTGLVRVMVDPTARPQPYEGSLEHRIEAPRGYARLHDSDMPATLDWTRVEFVRYTNGYHEVPVVESQCFLGNDQSKRMWYVGEEAEGQRIYEYIHPVSGDGTRYFDLSRFNRVFEMGVAALDSSR